MHVLAGRDSKKLLAYEILCIWVLLYAIKRLANLEALKCAVCCHNALTFVRKTAKYESLQQNKLWLRVPIQKRAI